MKKRRKMASLIWAVALAPLAAGAIKALIRVLYATGQADTFWVALLGGAACWWVVYLLLPKPMWVYVFGHELTHVVWSWAFGGRLKRFKVSSKGGHVLVTKSNFMVALAPYFFPLYTVLAVIGFGLGHWLWDWSSYRVWFHALIGVTYAFHMTLTWQILQTKQTDLTSQGLLFSTVIILLGNVLVLLLGIPLLAPGCSVMMALSWWLADTASLFTWIGQLG